MQEKDSRYTIFSDAGRPAGFQRTLPAFFAVVSL
jgi:hypothetical protein